ncbi:hypothetical protein C2G38_2158264 [Gigaspora rosea]|uniref:Uncharacterized protein n=1 Tax=Gigaspora rosea TaxID=44941 RepID=A0A397W4Q3_9GLOM|nr:hypothetical protein C2G38_2158264 [Gigaspora rosea]
MSVLSSYRVADLVGNKGLNIAGMPSTIDLFLFPMLFSVRESRRGFTDYEATIGSAPTPAGAAGPTGAAGPVPTLAGPAGPVSRAPVPSLPAVSSTYAATVQPPLVSAKQLFSLDIGMYVGIAIVGGIVGGVVGGAIVGIILSFGVYKKHLDLKYVATPGSVNI